MTKTVAAFEMTCEKLFERYSHLYFWTFTFKQVMPDWYYSQTWARFWRDFLDHFPDRVIGVKVAELHKDHGLHYHLILNQRICVGQVRRIGVRYGIGRVHVQLCDRGAVGYLRKYLMKNDRREFKVPIRKWSPVGRWDSTKVRSIEVEDPFTIQLADHTRGRQVDWLQYQVFRSNYRAWGNIYGPGASDRRVIGLYAGVKEVAFTIKDSAASETDPF